METKRFPDQGIWRNARLALLISVCFGGATRADKEPIPVLIKTLEAEDREFHGEPRWLKSTRAKAAYELGERGAEAKDAVPALIDALKDVEQVHFYAAWALGKIGSAARPLLIQALSNKDDRLRAGAVYALQEMGEGAKPAVPALLKALNDTDPRIREQIVWTLGGLPEKACLPALINSLKADNDADVRRAAAWALGQFRPAAKEAIPALVQALRDRDDFWARQKRGQRPSMSGLLNSRGVREFASEALASIGAAAVPAVLEVLKNGDHEQKSIAVTILGMMGSEAKGAVPVMVEKLEDKDLKFREEVAFALGDIGPQATSAVPALTKLLKESTGRMRVTAASALTKIDPRNRDGLPALIQELRDPKSEARGEAAASLKYFASRYGRNEEKGGVEALIEAVADAGGNVAGAAKCVSVEALIVALQDDVDEIRCLAAEALGAQGNNAKAAIKALMNALKDTNADVRKKAAEALLRIRNNE